MANLKQLKKAFSPITELGKRQRTMTLGDTEITLKTLTSKEDGEVQKSIAMQREEGQDLSPLEFVDAFRREVLSRAIIKIDDLDLSEDYVETGEQLDDGTPIKVLKSEAVGEILDTMSRIALTQIFDEMTALISEAEESIAKKVALDPVEEREALTKRLAELDKQATMSEVNESTSTAVSVASSLSKELG